MSVMGAEEVLSHHQYNVEGSKHQSRPASMLTPSSSEGVSLPQGECQLHGFLIFMTIFGYLASSSCVMSHAIMIGLRQFSEAEIIEVTGNFSELVGKGGFGIVYKGKYLHLSIAIKVLNKVSIKPLTLSVKYIQCHVSIYVGSDRCFGCGWAPEKRGTCPDTV